MDGYDINGIKLHTTISDLGYKDMIKNLDDLVTYSTSYMMSGKKRDGKDVALGKNNFMKAGKCDNFKSAPECRGKDRHIYVRNIPTGKIPPFNLSFLGVTGCNLQGFTEGRGILPGLIEDAYDINPFEMTLAALGKGNIGSKVCRPMSLPVGSRIYDKDSKRFEYETKCVAVENSTSTTDPKLNKKLFEKNKAFIPGPVQIFENFAIDNKTHKLYLTKYILWFAVISIFIILIIKFFKRFK